MLLYSTMYTGVSNKKDIFKIASRLLVIIVFYKLTKTKKKDKVHYFLYSFIELTDIALFTFYRQGKHFFFIFFFTVCLPFLFFLENAYVLSFFYHIKILIFKHRVYCISTIWAYWRKVAFLAGIYYASPVDSDMAYI